MMMPHVLVLLALVAAMQEPYPLSIKVMEAITRGQGKRMETN